MKISLKLRLDLASLSRLLKYAERNRSRFTEEATSQYVDVLRKRFVALSKGGKDWADLAVSTRKEKERLKREGKIRGNPRDILRRYGLLYKSLDKTPTQAGWNVGHVLNLRYKSGKSVQYVAYRHLRGSSILPIRRTVIMPTPGLKASMVGKTQKRFNVEVRRLNNLAAR